MVLSAIGRVLVFYSVLLPFYTTRVELPKHIVLDGQRTKHIYYQVSPLSSAMVTMHWASLKAQRQEFPQFVETIAEKVLAMMEAAKFTHRKYLIKYYDAADVEGHLERMWAIVTGKEERSTPALYELSAFLSWSMICYGAITLDYTQIETGMTLFAMSIAFGGRPTTWEYVGRGFYFAFAGWILQWQPWINPLAHRNG